MLLGRVKYVWSNAGQNGPHEHFRETEEAIMMNRRHVLYLFLATCLFFLWLCGQIFRDSTLFTALLFYIPSPALFALYLVCIFFCLFKKKFLWMLCFCLLAVAPAISTFFIENSFFRTPVAYHKGSNIRLVHWNVFRGRLGWNNIVTHLQEQNADFYVVE